ncbi:MAG: hypothetical protein JWR50_3980 [Mucilaginibacter sp.]|nr:hypothetical protein [Mucilaginibacter sp.]
MKLYVYLLLFSFVGHMAYAQNSRKDKNFVNDIINRKNVFY